MSKKDKYEDISSGSSEIQENDEPALGKVKTFFLKNRKRNLKAILSIVICLVLVIAAMAGTYIRKMLSLINYNEGNDGDPNATFATEAPDYDEDISYEYMYDIESADSIKELVKQWATNGGEKLHSKNVINVLLIGEDNDDGSHRSDSMILASVNRKEKKITLCSFLRDSYTYMLINGEERYDKTNHAYSWAGASKVMEVLSNNYKIKIDHYVSIDFASFEKVIDILGGVTVPITESEAAFMNRTTKVKGFESGDQVTLNGKRALIYARIRKLDSEIERTRRQRNVIASVIHNIKASSISDINKAIETFLPYVTTNYRSSEIVSLANQALNENWLKYEVVGMFEPSDEFRAGVNGFRTYTGYLDVWIVDYIKAAREVQIALYGNTNIRISDDHVSALDLVRGGVQEDYGVENGVTYYSSTYEEEETNWDPFRRWRQTTEAETETTERSNGIRELIPGFSGVTEPPETSTYVYGETSTSVNEENDFTVSFTPSFTEPSYSNEETGY